MKELVEELVLEKKQLQEQAALLHRIISYVDQDRGDPTPITLEALNEVVPPTIRMTQEGVYLDYPE